MTPSLLVIIAIASAFIHFRRITAGQGLGREGRSSSLIFLAAYRISKLLGKGCIRWTLAVSFSYDIPIRHSRHLRHPCTGLRGYRPVSKL